MMNDITMSFQNHVTIGQCHDKCRVQIHKVIYTKEDVVSYVLDLKKTQQKAIFGNSVPNVII